MAKRMDLAFCKSMEISILVISKWIKNMDKGL
jgi:hypothetical protein